MESEEELMQIAIDELKDFALWLSVVGGGGVGIKAFLTGGTGTFGLGIGVAAVANMSVVALSYHLYSIYKKQRKLSETDKIPEKDKEKIDLAAGTIKTLFSEIFLLLPERK